MLNRLLHEFGGKLTSKWVKIMKCFQDTAGKDTPTLMEL